MKKRVVLYLIASLAVFSLILVNSSASASKPSVPEFTVKLVSHPYNVAETTQIDPYTGKVYTYPGYAEENRSIEITIRNHPFISYQMADGNWSRLYYNLRFKGHFYTGDWTYYPLSPESGYLSASDSDYTVISLPKYLSPYDGSPAIYPDGSQFDFQAQALIGYDEPRYAEGARKSIIFVGNHFTGEASDWSETQTTTIGANPDSSTSNASPSTSPSTLPDSSPSPSQDSASTTTPNQSVNEMPLETTLYGIAVATAIVLVASLGALVYLKKRRRQPRVNVFCYEML